MGGQGTWAVPPSLLWAMLPGRLGEEGPASLSYQLCPRVSEIKTDSCKEQALILPCSLSPTCQFWGQPPSRVDTPEMPHSKRVLKRAELSPGVSSQAGGAHGGAPGRWLSVCNHQVGHILVIDLDAGYTSVGVYVVKIHQV